MTFQIKDLRVLAVDDSPQAMDLLCTMLDELGVQHVHAAGDGQAAMDLLDGCDTLPDIILCDWNMPRMSGLDLLRKIRLVDPSMPFIMVTGTATAESVAAAKAQGVTSYIVKPYSKSELEKKLKILARVFNYQEAAG